jgi:hypothetical protein
MSRREFITLLAGCRAAVTWGVGVAFQRLVIVNRVIGRRD